MSKKLSFAEAIAEETRLAIEDSIKSVNRFMVEWATKESLRFEGWYIAHIPPVVALVMRKAEDESQ